jgi:hypothetical protein
MSRVHIAVEGKLSAGLLSAQVVTEATPWDGGIVAQSNFGFGGEPAILDIAP